MSHGHIARVYAPILYSSKRRNYLYSGVKTALVVNRDFPSGSACNRSRHGLPLIVTAAPHPPCLARRNFAHFLLPVPISGFLPLQYKVIKLLCRTFASFMRGLFFRHPVFCRLTPPTRYTERSPVAVERVVQCDRESHRTTYAVSYTHLTLPTNREV